MLNQNFTAEHFNDQNQFLTTSETQNQELAQEDFILQEKTPSKYDQKDLISLHCQYGNKWKQISEKIPGSNDINVKNKFYALIRKAVRMLNVYIKLILRLRSIKEKTFRLNCIFKLANLVEFQRQQKTKGVKAIFTNLLCQILELSLFDSFEFKKSLKQGNLQHSGFFSQSLLKQMVLGLRAVEQFFIQKKLIKKGRSKRKFQKKDLLQKIQDLEGFKKHPENTDTQSSQLKSSIFLNEICAKKNYIEKQSPKCQELQSQLCQELQMIGDFPISEQSEISKLLESDPFRFDPLIW